MGAQSSYSSPMRADIFYRDPAWRGELGRGVRASAPAAPGIVAWGLVTGVAMVKSGLAVPWAIAISLLVYAGSAQLAALPLIAAGQPFWIVALAGFVTNLRFVIYSASLRRWFEAYSKRRRLALGYFTGDFTFAMFMDRVRREGEFAHRDAWFLGACGTNWLVWQVSSIVGSSRRPPCRAHGVCNSPGRSRCSRSSFPPVCSGRHSRALRSRRRSPCWRATCRSGSGWSPGFSQASLRQ